MKILNYFFTYLLISILIACLGILAYNEIKPEALQKSQLNSFQNALRVSDNFVLEPKVDSSYFTKFDSTDQKPQVQAWIPSWGMDAGIKSIRENRDMFDVISPVFYEMDGEGNVNTNLNGLSGLREVTAGSRIKIIPTFSTFEIDGFSRILNDSAERSNLIKFLSNQVRDNNFDGIDLNVEGVYLKDKDLFYEFVEGVQEEIHNQDKLLSISILSEWGDSIDYGYRPETREVMDYERLGQIADQVRIMAYDFTGSAAALPGPIAPEEWVIEVLEYAVKRIPREKIVLGSHLYGYGWEIGEGAGKAYDYRGIQGLKYSNENFFEELFSETHMEPAFRYNTLNSTFFGYYADKEYVEERLDLAQKYGIKGLCFWRLGDSPI